MSKVMVLRDSFTPRDLEIDRLSGVIEANIRTLSYVHVSMGRERVEVATRPSNVPELLVRVERAFMARNVRALENLISIVRVDYVDNVTYGDRVCIPGSTIKGLLRARLELCPSLDGKSISCIYSAVQPITTLPNPGSHGWRHARIWRAVAEDRGPSCNPLATSDYTVCKVCDIFGAPGLVGRVMPSNFCCDKSACEARNLPYGEKLYAIKPGTVLEGSIAFTALTLGELGALFLSMGLTRGSTQGVPILVGKHKYSYEDMGVARFEVKRVVLPRRLEPVLSELGIEFSRKGYELVCEGKSLLDLVSRAIERALEDYPPLRNLHGFSEAERKREVIKS